MSNPVPVTIAIATKQGNPVQIPPGGATLITSATGSLITLGITPEFRTGVTWELEPGSSLPWPVGPLWAKATTPTKFLVLAGLYNFANPNVAFTGSKVKITGPIKITPTGNSVSFPTGKVFRITPTHNSVTFPTGKKMQITPAGNVITGQMTSTGIPLQATAPQILPTTFGTGATGTVTLTVNASLAKDANYKNLTVNTGVILKPAGHLIFVKTVLTLNGTITASGGTGTGIVHTGGTGTFTAPGGAGSLGSTLLGGGNGGSAKSVTHVLTCIAGSSAPSTTYQGGTGGAGFKAPTTVSSSTVKTGGSAVRKAVVPPSFTTLRNKTQGGGAGGGAAATFTGAAGSHLAIASGGGAGGPIFVAAATIKGTGNVKANGGKGGSTSQTGAASAGGGGGAGTVFLYFHVSTTWHGKVFVTAGAAGIAKVGSVTHTGNSGHTGFKGLKLKFTGNIKP